MEALAKALLKREVALVVVLATLVFCGALGLIASGVEQDDDVLAFLPQDNPDVQLFYEINKRFGGLDVALVGIEAPELFTSEFIGALKELTDSLNDIGDVSYALSITNVDDVTADPDVGGIRYAPLIEVAPTTNSEEDIVRERVMSRDHLLGQLVSREGDAVLLYCFLAADADPRATAGVIRDAVNEHLPDATKYWGGAPFVSTYIYDTAQADMDKLTPWSVVAIIAILMFTFRDLRGSLLALLATGMGIAVSMGTMAALSIEYSIVLSSMPVILFAVGSAYSIHILSHYYEHESELGRDEAIRRTLVGIGPTVIAAGLTTVAGLLSFVAMDIEPMRTFGIFTAVGIFATLVLSVTFVPAVLRLLGPKRKASGWSASAMMVSISTAAGTWRGTAGLLLLVVSATAAIFVTRVDARMDNAAFFESGSEPDLSERFLAEHFGGSQFIQVQVKADLKDPAVLLQVQTLGDAMLAWPQITDALHIAGPLTQANEAMEGLRRIPGTSQKVGILLQLMGGNKALQQLVTADATEAVIQLKVDAPDAEELARVLSEVERYVEAAGPKVHPDVYTVQRIAALGRQFGVKTSRERVRRVLGGGLVAGDLEDIVADRIVAFIGTDEFLAVLPQEETELLERLAAAVVALGPESTSETLEAAVSEVLALPTDDMTVGDTVFSLETPVSEMWQRAESIAGARQLAEKSGLRLPEGPAGERYLDRLAGILAQEFGPADADAPVIEYRVSGLPVLYRGLEKSVTSNQWKSLGLALVLVVLILSAVFRSPWSGLLATTPTFLTLLLVYGAMGALEVHLDIGTSMLASLIVGAGVDYAVHMVAAWRAREGEPVVTGAEHAARTTAPAIWTNATMVAAGFYVLTLGDARPLQNVGLLTASAMLVAAATTFVAIPVLARKRSYSGASVLAALEGGSSNR